MNVADTPRGRRAARSGRGPRRRRSPAPVLPLSKLHSTLPMFRSPTTSRDVSYARPIVPCSSNSLPLSVCARLAPPSRLCPPRSAFLPSPPEPGRRARIAGSVLKALRAAALEVAVINREVSITNTPHLSQSCSSVRSLAITFHPLPFLMTSISLRVQVPFARPSLGRHLQYGVNRGYGCGLLGPDGMLHHRLKPHVD